MATILRRSWLSTKVTSLNTAGYPLTLECQSVPIGSSSISKKLRQLIKINNPDLKDDLLKDEHLLDLKLGYSTVVPNTETQNVQFEKLKFKFSESWIILDDYFGDPEKEEPNIAYSFLKSLNSIANVECLERVCQNVVLAGGIWHVKGFKQLFKKKVLKELTENPDFSRLKTMNIHQKIRNRCCNEGFADLPFSPVDLPWVGCSIASSTGNI